MYRLVAVVAVITGTLLCASAASAQPMAGRVWLDLGIGVQVPAEKAFTASSTPVVHNQPATFVTDYTLGTALAFEIGGGILFTKRIGAGLTFTNAFYFGNPATLSAHVPHPFFPNAYGDDTAVTTSTMPRSERGFHIQAMAVIRDNGRIRIRAFGGPSYVRMSQTAVELFAISQLSGDTTNANTIIIGSGSLQTESVASTWGFHAGGDVSYFLARTVGIGGFVRYMHGSVEVTNPLAQTGTIALKVGGVQAGGSFTVKF